MASPQAIQAIEVKRNELRQQGIDVGAPKGETQDAIFGGGVRAFANGSIYWHPNTGAHFLGGAILQAYVNLNGPEIEPRSFRRPLGYPVTDITSDGARQLEFTEFEFGSIYRTGGMILGIHQNLAITLPKLGVPSFVGLTGLSFDLPPIVKSGQPSAAVITALQDLWRGRIALQAVDRRDEIIPLEVQISNTLLFGLRQHVVLPAGIALRDRTLYNVVLVGVSGGIMNIAPHSVYCRANWDRFGIIHITDLHLSFRADEFQTRLAGHDVPSALRYFNPNDAFRHFIRHANRLHRKGLLDLLLVTGDLVDYQSGNGANNFELFEQIMLGQVPSHAGVPSEELLVPMAVTLGNHDYRRNPYDLNFIIEVANFDVHEFENYEPLNLTKRDALFLQGDLQTPTRPRAVSAGMVAIDTPTYALQRICGDREGKEASFALNLGRHRIVLIDSKHDIGVVDSISGWLKEKLGFGSEDEANFLGGSPNLKGLDEKHLQMVRQALRDAGDQGVVIVGIHGPCLNPAGSEFAHFLRETEHPTTPVADIKHYLDAHGQDSDAPAWMAAVGKPYFNRGANEELLDGDGVSKGQLDPFLRLAAGGPGPGGERLRPVDLILSGHGHFRTEFKVRWDEQIQGGLYFFDFYTENPRRYYGTRQFSFHKGREQVHIFVTKRAGLNEPIVRHHNEKPEFASLKVPPYPTPLNSALDKGQWWRDNRPIFLQTGSLGLIESRSNTRRTEVIPSRRPEPSFSGFRFLTVSGSAVESIRYARFPEIRQAGLSASWEPSTIIAYDKERGVAEIYLVQAGGQLRLLKHHDGLRNSYSLIVRGDFGGRGLVDALFYDPAANTGEFWEFSADGSMRLINRRTDFRRDWTHIVPMHVRMGGTTGLLFYSQRTRQFELHAVGDGGVMERQFLGETTAIDNKSNSALSHVIPVDATGNIFSNLFVYDTVTGHSKIDQGTIGLLRAGWNQIVPGRFGGSGFTNLFFYQASTGTGEFLPISGDGPNRSHTGLRQSWTHIAAGNFGGGKESDLLFYEAPSRSAEVWSVDSNGEIARVSAIADWGPWSHIVA